MKNNILNVMKNAFGGTYNTVAGHRSSWNPFISEPFSGAWQRNMEVTREDMLSYPAVFACVTLIANDISKLRLNLVRRDTNGIWVEFENAAYSPVLRRPNRYQNLIQFIQSWVLSILIHGNAYILKERDNRNVVTALYVLDPLKIYPLIGSDGSIYYEVPADELSRVSEAIRIPQSEIIHDRTHTFYHPLVGISPLYAAALSVGQGKEIQKNSAAFFKNNSRPGGILTAPGAISDESIKEIKDNWTANYTGNNAGKVAVLADGLTYKSFDVQSAANSQVIEQLKWSSEIVCSVFHVPPYKIGVGSTPTSGNVQSENIRYLSEALQIRIESIQALLQEGLNMSYDIAVKFDLDDLLRMDSKTLIETEEIGVGAGIKKINESRKKLNLSPVEGGDTPYLQQQNFSIAALAKRDSSEDPFGKASSSASNGANSNQNTNEDNNEDEEDNTDVERFITELRLKTAERFVYAK